MRILWALGALLVLCQAASAEVPIKGDLKVPAFGMADLTASVEGGGKATRYRWKVLTGNPVKQVSLDGRLLFSGPPGSYRVTVTAVDFDAKLFDEGEVTVVIGGKPDPGPDPDPPGPDPSPVSPLTKALSAAFAKEADPDKRAHIQALATIYGTAAAQARKGDAKTVGQLFKSMEAGAEAAKVKGKVPLIMAEIAAHCKRLPGKSSQAIDDTNRELIASTLLEVSTSLKEVAP